MSIKILIDMNLSPDWVPLLQNAGFMVKNISRASWRWLYARP